MLELKTEMEKMDEGAASIWAEDMVLLGSRGANGVMEVLRWF